MSSQQVAMTHPSIPGTIAYTTMAAFTEIWQPKGWVLGGADAGDALQASAVLTGELIHRPAADVVVAGTIFIADDGSAYRSDGGNWIDLIIGTGTTGGGGGTFDFVSGGNVTGLTASTDTIRANVTEL